MRTHRMFLLSLLILMNLQMCSAFTFYSDYSYITSTGGTVHFARNIIATKWEPWGTLTRFSQVQWNGQQRGVLAVDVSNGDTVNFTSLRDGVLVYDVTGVGGATQEIYYNNLGRPATVIGGTYVMNGNNVLITTAGATTVTITWSSTSFNDVRGLLTSSLFFLGLIPLMAATALMIAAYNGNIDMDKAIMIITMCVTVSLVTVILGVFIKI